MFAPLDQVNEARNVAAIGTQRPWYDLPVKHLCRDVGVVSGGLPPAEGAILRRDADKANKLIVEGFKAADPGHLASCVTGIDAA